jgi:transcriptional regulator with XRE-family HTH domain
MGRRPKGYVQEGFVPKKDPINVRFASNLSRIRQEKMVALTTLADRSGLSKPFLDEVEKANKSVSFGTIDKLAEALQADCYEFFKPVTEEPEEVLTPEERSKKKLLEIYAFLEQSTRKYRENDEKPKP